MLYLIVFLGAGIGGALRHGVNVGAARLLGPSVPYGTLIVNIVGSRYDNLANTTKLDDYTTIDLVGEVRLGDWFVQGKIANASDEKYETAAFYYQDGRSYFLTLGYQPR